MGEANKILEFKKRHEVNIQDLDRKRTTTTDPMIK